MTYEYFMKDLELSERCQLSLAEQVVPTLLPTPSKDDDEQQLDLENFHRVIAAILGKDAYAGDQDDFHNIAVELANSDRRTEAFYVVAKGVEMFPYSVDLLADCILYGQSCTKLAECDAYLERLRAISFDKWNWRAFTFVIDYLLEVKGASDFEASREQAMELAKKFKSSFPTDERCYIAEYKIYHATNDMQDRAMAVLEEGLEKLNVAPQCALKSAEIYYRDGNYKKALEHFERCKKDFVQPNSPISIGYLFLMSAMCKMALLFRTEAINDSIDEKQIRDIYKECRISEKLVTRRSSYWRNLQSMIKIIEIKTGVYYEDD